MVISLAGSGASAWPLDPSVRIADVGDNDPGRRLRSSGIREEGGISFPWPGRSPVRYERTTTRLAHTPTHDRPVLASHARRVR